MNDRQNTVVATTVVGVVLVVVFLCPWRVETSGAVRWSPVYQQPLTYERTYDAAYGEKGGSHIESEEANIAFGLLALQVLAVGVAGGAMYVATGDSSLEDGSPAKEGG